MNYISNWFHFYETTESFEVHRKQGMINPDSICFLKETSQIYTQNTLFGICKERFEALEEMVLAHESKLRDILGIEGPSINDGIVNNISDLVNFLDGFSDEDNLKEVIEGIRNALTNQIESINRDLSARMTALENNVNASIEYITELSNSINTRVDSIEDTVSDHTTSINEINSTIQSHIRQYELFKAGYEAYKEYVESKFSSTEAKITATNSSLASLRSEVASLNEVVSSIDSELGKVDDAIAAAEELARQLEERFEQEIANNAQFKREVTAELNELKSNIGQPNGIAGLGGDGKVPANQLPSYVDDVIEKPAKEAFPVQGEAGKIYVALDTNLTYRWSGSTYVEISQSIALGETSSTAYAGNKGKKNADDIVAHISDKDNPHEVTKAQIGLDNVDNTSDMNKPISTAVQQALNNKVEMEPGKGLVSLEDANNIHEANEKIATLEENLQYEVTRATTAESTINSSLASHKADNTNPHGVTKAQIGLGNVDNTSDLNKPISTATQAALDQLISDVDGLDALIDTKVEKVEGKVLSSNDFTDEYKSKVDNGFLGKTFATVDSLAEYTPLQAGEVVFIQSIAKYKYWNGTDWNDFGSNGGPFFSPDEKTLTVQDGQIKLKDVHNTSGMSYVICPPPSDESPLPDLSSENTIYEIRYRYVGNNEGILREVPVGRNSVLYFTSGQIVNCTVQADDSYIVPTILPIFKGSKLIHAGPVMPEWFVEDRSNSTLDIIPTITACYYYSPTILLTNSSINYTIGSLHNLRRGFTLIGIDSRVTLRVGTHLSSLLESSISCNFRNINFDNATISENYPRYLFRDFTNNKVINATFDNCSGDCFIARHCNANITIRNCDFERIGSRHTGIYTMVNNSSVDNIEVMDDLKVKVNISNSILGEDRGDSGVPLIISNNVTLNITNSTIQCFRSLVCTYNGAIGAIIKSFNNTYKNFRWIATNASLLYNFLSRGDTFIIDTNGYLYEDLYPGEYYTIEGSTTKRIKPHCIAEVQSLISTIDIEGSIIEDNTNDRAAYGAILVGETNPNIGLFRFLPSLVYHKTYGVKQVKCISYTSYDYISVANIPTSNSPEFNRYMCRILTGNTFPKFVISPNTTPNYSDIIAGEYVKKGNVMYKATIIPIIDGDNITYKAEYTPVVP